jgi:hypothetical protein
VLRVKSWLDARDPRWRPRVFEQLKATVVLRNIHLLVDALGQAAARDLISRFVSLPKGVIATAQLCPQALLLGTHFAVSMTADLPAAWTSNDCRDVVQIPVAA